MISGDMNCYAGIFSNGLPSEWFKFPVHSLEKTQEPLEHGSLFRVATGAHVLFPGEIVSALSAGLAYPDSAFLLPVIHIDQGRTFFSIYFVDR